MLSRLFLKSILKVTTFIKKHRRDLIDKFLKVTYFLPTYYRTAELMWQEGLFIDFLQKKILDKWLRRHLIFSSNLFSDSLLARRVVDFYWFLINLPTHHTNLFFFNGPVFNFIFTITFMFLIFALVFILLGWAAYGLGLC